MQQPMGGGMQPVPDQQPMYSQAGASVFGVPLQPGERVVRYQAFSYTGEMVFLVIMGILFSCLLIGFWFLYEGITKENKSAKGFVVTTHRIIVGANPGFHGGQPIVIPLNQVADLEPVRRNIRAGGGGLLGAAISAGVSAVANSMANSAAKVNRSYWSRAEDVILISHAGERTKLGIQNAADNGVFIAQGMMHGGFDSCADVPYENS